MTIFDYYLRGADSDTTRAALLAAGAIVALPADGQRLCDVSGDGFDVDEIGPVYQGGTLDAAGNVVTAPTAVPGWHVNLRLQRELAAGELAALGSIIVTPEPGTPYRVWA